MTVPRHQPPELDAGDQTQRRRIAGVARNGANEHRFARGLRLRRAGGAAHLKEAAGGAGVQCSGGGDGRSGGRSSAGCGDAAAVRWESNWRWRWLPAELLSMVTRADAGCGGSDHGGAMAGGGGLSGSMGTTTTRRNRARGERGTKEKLTAKQTSGSVARGRLGGDGRRWRSPAAMQRRRAR